MDCLETVGHARYPVLGKVLDSKLWQVLIFGVAAAHLALCIGALVLPTGYYFNHPDTGRLVHTARLVGHPSLQTEFCPRR